MTASTISSMVFAWSWAIEALVAASVTISRNRDLLSLMIFLRGFGVIGYYDSTRERFEEFEKRDEGMERISIGNHAIFAAKGRCSDRSTLRSP